MLTNYTVCYNVSSSDLRSAVLRSTSGQMQKGTLIQSLENRCHQLLDLVTLCSRHTSSTLRSNVVHVQASISVKSSCICVQCISLRPDGCKIKDKNTTISVYLHQATPLMSGSSFERSSASHLSCSVNITEEMV